MPDFAVRQIRPASVSYTHLNDKVGGSRERLRHAGHAAAADLEPGVQQGLCGPALALVSAEQKAGFGHDSTSYPHPMQFLRFR